MAYFCFCFVAFVNRHKRQGTTLTPDAVLSGFTSGVTLFTPRVKSRCNQLLPWWLTGLKEVQLQGTTYEAVLSSMVCCL
jgi:hypothetical protein